MFIKHMINSLCYVRRLALGYWLKMFDEEA